jgi:hypothetical protein
MEEGRKRESLEVKLIEHGDSLAIETAKQSFEDDRNSMNKLNLISPRTSGRRWVSRSRAENTALSSRCILLETYLSLLKQQNP